MIALTILATIVLVGCIIWLALVASSRWPIINVVVFVVGITSSLYVIVTGRGGDRIVCAVLLASLLYSAWRYWANSAKRAK